MRKIFCFIGSRANYSSIKSVLREINKHPELKLFLIVGASAVLDKYGSVDQLIKKDGFKIYKKVFFLIEGETPLTMSKSTGLGLIEMSSLINEINPDIVLTIGDRFETMCATLAAAYMNIPIAHTMGGEVSGTIDESIRHAVTKLSHIHFPATRDAAKRIERMGEIKENIFLVGCPRIDLVKEILKKKINNKLLNNILNQEGVGDKIDVSKPFLIVSQHPVTTEYKDSEKHIIETLKAVAQTNLQAVILWPNPDAGSGLISKGIRKWREKFSSNKMRFFKNLEIENYVHLMSKTICLVGNSSSGIREGAFIGVPVVNIGTRQSKREHYLNVISSKNKAKDIFKSIMYQLRHGRYKPSIMYGNGNASKKIVKILNKIKVNIQKNISY
jgi:UDP-hydrolysing UDP-N-acetyl-D-glucosamine 2-epimerase